MKDEGFKSLIQKLPESMPKAQKPGRDGRADVGAHDDVDGLTQRHQARVDKADHHDRGGGRALNDGRDAKTR